MPSSHCVLLLDIPIWYIFAVIKSWCQCTPPSTEAKQIENMLKCCNCVQLDALLLPHIVQHRQC